MIAYFILGIGLLFGLLLLARWVVNADPKLLAWLIKVVVGILALGLGALVIATDRIQWVIFLIPMALPLYFHWRSNQIRRRNAQGPAPGGRSEINTGWLRMELDHDTGAMRGTIQRGRYAGRGLAGMTAEELRDLLEELEEDSDSAALLEAYLDRMHGAAWREGDEATERAEAAGEAPPRRPPPGGMSAEEALEILGLASGATPDQVKEAHRRLMTKLHPDRGGSTYLAAKINQAKDVLLKHR